MLKQDRDGDWVEDDSESPTERRLISQERMRRLLGGKVTSKYEIHKIDLEENPVLRTLVPDIDERLAAEDSCCYVVSATLRFKGLEVRGSEEVELLKQLKIQHLGKSRQGLKEIVRYNRIAPRIVAAIDNSPERSEIYEGVYGDLQDVKALLRAEDFETGYRSYRQMLRGLVERLGITV